MQIKDFIALYQENKIVQKLKAYLKQDPQHTTLHPHLRGISGSLDALLIAALQHYSNQLQLVVLENKEAAWAIYGDLSNLVPAHSILLLPGLEKRTVDSSAHNKIIQHKRTEIIHAISEKKSIAWVVTHIAALSEKILDPSLITDISSKIEVGQTLSLQELKKTLRAQRFTKVDFVYKQGEFAIRGGIIDIYSASESFPYRITLWGNTVSSIGIFNPKDQKTFKKTTTVTILSNQEIIAEHRLAYTSFSSCLPAGTCIWIQNKSNALEALQKLNDTVPIDPLTATHTPYETRESFIASIAPFHQITFGQTQSIASAQELIIDYDSEKQPYFQQNFNLLTEDLYKRNQHNYKVFITAISTGQLARLDAILHEKEPKPVFTPLLLGLREGYIDHTAKIVCYADHQIFNRYYRYQPPKSYSPTEALLIDTFSHFQIGDYVVHSDFGIGRFSGLHTLPINTHKKEAIRLIYKDNDVVYVNVHDLHKISKYTSKDGTVPNLHKLGTVAWSNKKSAVKKQIKDIAKELITLYAERKKTTGFAFGKDTVLDAALAASFYYEDTPDQALAIAAIKEDMERPEPMDRLVCGDVGFGKTEVAIRAAFKAAEYGKQVALLVPTTILALQHYNTFINRLANLPIRVNYINRFKTKQEIQQTLAYTASGKIDILIGTHKLLMRDVKFKDLGLLIIDEEQKFGVSAKEKLKQLRLNVDTLTLTATPIPRTLHFSLMGARDLSMLTTPPANRRPVKTTLYHFDLKIIKAAIEAEIARNGQVFFLHNKVNNINAIAQTLASLLPTARICVAHGQMTGSTLEEKILQFIAGRYDVLVATSIIESGMDIPNANTIIINDSHLLGLADIHQIRGRVGRSNTQAFCYLLIPENINLTPEAKLRLAALEELSELGDGFKLAMRDLDIRGAGNLFGAAQSGFMADIGCETYYKILEDAIEEVKNKDFKTLFTKDPKTTRPYSECSIETDYEALLPSTYVQNTAQRMLLYTRLSKIKDNNQLNLFKEELVDRFGPLPIPVETLLETIPLRWEAQRIGFQKLSLKGQILCCYLGSDFQKRNQEMWDYIIQYIQQNATCCQLKKIEGNLIFTINTQINSIVSAKNLLATIGTPLDII
ncbi:transcription-repair coupling factor [Candidatus Cardinium hertigii]|uniref:transcription-repair coupling factor n=1 Tax=Candidatus Cardinium hertigii TaxID=247481 RepID=UPI0016163745|nr:transcription-repair coupling factor [Candidatus Cardinium hertigii]